MGSTLVRVIDPCCGEICVEAANALEDAVVLEPGASHTMGYRLGVS